MADAIDWYSVPQIVRNRTPYFREKAAELQDFLHARPLNAGILVCCRLDDERLGVIAEDVEEYAKAARYFGTVEWVLPEEATEEPWVKLAYSPTINGAAKFFQFAPSRFNDITGIKPSPLASSLIGAGALGGVGYMGGALMDRYGDPNRDRKMRYRLGGMGAMMGAAPGALWGASRLSRRAESNAAMKDAPSVFSPGTLWSEMTDGTDVLPDGPLKKAASAFGTGAIDYAVDTNRLGQVLWDAGVPAPTTTAVLGVAEAASQLPGGPGGDRFTPQQVGLLSTMLGTAGGGLQGYIVGRAVGAGLGALVALSPESQQQLGRSGAIIGAARGFVNTILGR